MHRNLLYRRKRLQNHGLLNFYENVPLTRAEMEHSFELYTRIKDKENIEENLKHINVDDAKKLRELTRKIKEQSFPVLMTNNKVGNLSNRFTSQGRIFGKFMEFMLKNNDGLKNINKMTIRDIVNLIIEYTPETLVPTNIKYNINEQVVKISQIPFQTNIIEEVRQMMKILLRYKYVKSYIDVEAQDYGTEIRFKFGNVSFWEEMFDWKIGECPIPTRYTRSLQPDIVKDEADINSILKWIKQGYGLGYGDKVNDYHRSYVTCSIVPYLLLDNEYELEHREKAYGVVSKISQTLKANPQEQTYLDTHLSFGINVQVHTSQNVKSIDSTFGYVGIYNHYRSMFENHRNTKIFKDMQEMKDRYYSRLHHLNWGIERLQELKGTKEDQEKHAETNISIDWSDIIMEGYEDEEYYEFGFYDKQIAYKQAQIATLKKIYRRSKQPYSPIQTREFMLRPGEIHNSGNANGQQMIGLVLCKQMHHVIDVISPEPIVSIETKEMEEIPSVNLATMSLHYRGPFRPYIKQCYELCHTYKTWASVVATCQEMHKIMETREYNEWTDPNIITNKIIKSNIYADFLNICDFGDYVSGFSKNCYHVPYNHINGYMITITDEVQRYKNIIHKPQYHVIFNLEHKEVEILDLYAGLGISMVSMSTVLRVLLNKNVSDPDVVKAFGKQSKYVETDINTAEEPPRKKRKVESPNRVYGDRWMKDNKHEEGNLSKNIINRLNTELSSSNINDLYANHFNHKIKSQQEKREEYINKAWKIIIIKPRDVARFKYGFDENMIGGKVIKVDYKKIYGIAANMFKMLTNNDSVEKCDGEIPENLTATPVASVGIIDSKSFSGICDDDGNKIRDENISIMKEKGFRDGDFTEINDETMRPDGVHVIRNELYCDMKAREAEIEMINSNGKRSYDQMNEYESNDEDNPSVGMEIDTTNTGVHTEVMW